MIPYDLQMKLEKQQNFTFFTLKLAKINLFKLCRGCDARFKYSNTSKPLSHSSQRPGEALAEKTLNCLAMGLGRQAVGETGRRRKGELKLKINGLSLFASCKAVTFIKIVSVSLTRL